MREARTEQDDAEIDKLTSAPTITAVPRNVSGSGVHKQYTAG